MVCVAVLATLLILVSHSENMLNWFVVSNIFLLSPLFREDEPILTSIFFKWVETTT